MTHWAAPGVQCVCIDNDFGDGLKMGGCQIPKRVPMINEVLTVKQVWAADDRIFLTFEEIEDRQTDTCDGLTIWAIISFEACCFRPLIKRPTDISIFKAMLTPAGKVPVDA